MAASMDSNGLFNWGTFLSTMGASFRLILRFHKLPHQISSLKTESEFLAMGVKKDGPSGF
jgi:hypothetical protein